MALDTAFADGHYQGYDEEREPAENECTGHDGQGFGRLFLPFRLQADVLLLFFSLWSVRIVRQVVKRDIVCLRCTAGQLGPFSIPEKEYSGRIRNVIKVLNSYRHFSK